MPRLASVHPFDAEAADEEGLLLEHSFMSFFDAYADIPGYTAWQHSHGAGPAYQYLKRLLQFIQWQKRQRGEMAESGRWVLKSPHHLRHLATLLHVFPDALLIQTHRDPLLTIPSLASFNTTLWQIYSDPVDPQRCGRQWSAIMAWAMQNTLALRQTHGEQAFIDIHYQDTLTQPLAAVAAIYQRAGLTLPAAIEQRMQHYLEQHGRAQRPLHDYSLEHYGLSTTQISADFAAYRTTFCHTPEAQSLTLTLNTARAPAHSGRLEHSHP